MPSRILVTGSSGLVGEAVARRLVAEVEVLGLDLTTGPHTHVLGSVTDGALIDSVMEGVEAVVHTAALHAPHVHSRPAAEFHEVNVRGTELLVAAAVRHRVRRFVYTSTTSVYGTALASVREAVWVTEALPPGPRDIYDETKLAAEACCLEAAERFGLGCVSLRIGRCYPQPEELIALYRLYRGVDLRDVAEAHRLALQADLHRPGAVYNIAARTPFRREDVGELKRDAGAVIRRRCPLVAEGFRRRGWPLPLSIDRVYVIDRARQELGFEPACNAESLFAGEGTLRLP
jgi:UDP-glucose 4-epimerase